MSISSCIDVVEVPEPQYEDFTLTWSFGGNSSIISLCGNNSRVKSTEHWITDCSDIFSFNAGGELSNIGLSVPNKNHLIDVKTEKISFGKLVLSCEKIYTIEPMPMRMFDSLKRKLFCFNESIASDSCAAFLKLHDDLDIIVSNKGYCGYVINNPLSYFSNETNGYIDVINKPDDNEYILMGCFFNIMSDNNVEKYNGDIDRVVVELKEIIMPSLNLIRSEFRRDIVKSIIQELLDFYC
ncbi:hypothetical protein CDR68_24985 [Salmonella enterica]|nr:hypothetical protein [Salmonella enterica]